jgi:hypothetical protein
MALPDVRFTIQDGALGLSAETNENVPCLLGVSTLGTAGTIYTFNDKQALVAALGAGPLVEQAALYLDQAGGPVKCVPIASSTAGACGAFTHSVGTQTASPTGTGAAVDAYEVIVKVTKAGASLAANTAAVQYSLDGGDNFSPETAVPVGGVISPAGTGLTITFADGTFVVGDTYTATVTAPSFTLSEAQTAVDGILQKPDTWGWLHLVGIPASAAASAAMAAGLQSKMDAAENAYRYAFALFGCTDDEAASNAALIAAFASTSCKRVMAAAGYVELVSPISGLTRKRSAVSVIGPRIKKAPVGEDLGRVRSGPVGNLASLYHDEQATPNLDAARFASLRTIIGTQGYYVTNGRMMAPAGSDFAFAQYRRVMDLACTVARAALVKYLNDSVRLDSATGFILEAEARAIEADVNGQLEDKLVASGQASSSSVTIKRDANIGSTQTMPVTVRVQPLGYAKFITVDIGFANPALQPKAA